MQNRMTPAPHRVLLSGASGLVGLALVRALADHRIPTLQLVRGTPAQPGQVQWDPNLPQPVHNLAALETPDAADYTAVSPAPEAAIHLSGANLAGHRWNAAYKREIFESRVHSTRALVNVFRQMHKPPSLLLCASATGIYGDRKDEILNEDSTCGQGFLADLCRAWEAEAARAEQIGIRVVYLRFGAVLTPQGGALAKMLPIFRLGLGGPLGSGRQWMSWIALSDVIRAILFLLEQETTLSGPVNLVTPNPVTSAEFARTLGRALHRPAILPAPAFALRAIFGEMADATLLASTRALPHRLVQAGFNFELPTLDAALPSLI